MKLIKDKTVPPQPDPYILKADGKYYIYATGKKCVNVFVASSLDGDWRYLGPALEEEGMQEFWAPCVIFRDGVYYMYYSSYPITSDNVHEQRVKVATSASPEGKFVYRKDLLPAFSIDPHVVKSGEDYYIFYSLNDETAERAGTYVAVDRLTDMFTAEGKPVPAVVPTLDEEIFMRDRFKKGQHWHTVEGGFYMRKGDDHYLMYSGNCYENEKYFVGYAFAHTAENDLRKIKFEKQPSENVYAPLICRNGEEEGTGHNSILEEDGNYYFVYHARDIGESIQDEECRTARMCRLSVDGKNLKIENR